MAATWLASTGNLTETPPPRSAGACLLFLQAFAASNNDGGKGLGNVTRVLASDW